MAVSELSKVAREDPDAVEVLQVLGNLLREAGQVERAIQVHQALLARPDLTRGGARARAWPRWAPTSARPGSSTARPAPSRRCWPSTRRTSTRSSACRSCRRTSAGGTEAYEIQTRLSRLRKTDDSLVLGHLQAAMGQEASQAGTARRRRRRPSAPRSSLDRRVFPAHLGLADLAAPTRPRAARPPCSRTPSRPCPSARTSPSSRLARLYTAAGEPSRFAALCERIIAHDPRDWRARLQLARHAPRARGGPRRRTRLLLRALESNPQVLLLHLEIWRTLGAPGREGRRGRATTCATAESAVFYRDPHVCTACRYRADDMLWRCPHCHEWDTFVEERVGLTAAPHGR